MAHVDDLTFVNAAQILGSDNLYLGRPSDGADPDKRTDIDELISRIIGPDALGISPFYEYGTWMPELTSGTPPSAVTYSSRNGRYVRVGELVWIHGLVGTSARTGGSGSVRITGLPVQPRTIEAGMAAISAVEYGYLNPASGRSIITARILNADSSIGLVTNSPGGGAAWLDMTEWPNNGNVRFTTVYLAD